MQSSRAKLPPQAKHPRGLRHPFWGLRRDKPPPGISDCLDLYAMHRRRLWSRFRFSRTSDGTRHLRIDRSILPSDSKYCWWAGPVSIDGDFRTRRRFRVLLPCDLSSGRNPLLFDVGYFSGFSCRLFFTFSATFRVFSLPTRRKCVL